MLLKHTLAVVACLAFGASCHRVSAEPASAGRGSIGEQSVPDVVQKPADQGEPRVVREPAPDPGPSRLITIEGGNYEPLFPGKDAAKVVPVAAFELEVHPVSNAQFIAFLQAVPKWRRSRVPRLFADRGYLALWLDDLDPGEGMLDRPVVGVSWFAARAYCRWRGRRLPTVAEWEMAAAVPLQGGGSPSKAVLRWYGRPAGADPAVIGSASVSANGVRDLHGLVWEWVENFSSSMVTGDGRSDTDLQRGLFCGAGAVGAARPEDYAAFMRYAMRSSLIGARTTRSLGFRCARTRTSRKQ